MREPIASATEGEGHLIFENDSFTETFLREETDPPTLLPFRRIRFAYEAQMRVKPVPLTVGDLAGTGYAYGKGSLLEDEVFIVMSEGEHGSEASLRVTDSEGKTSDWLADRKTQELKPRGDTGSEQSHRR
jgi:hypothetical protein